MSESASVLCYTYIDCLAESQPRVPRDLPANTSYLQHISRTLILNCVSLLLFSLLFSRLELYFLGSGCDTVPYPSFIQDSFSSPSTCVLVFVVCFSHLYLIFNKRCPIFSTLFPRYLWVVVKDIMKICDGHRYIRNKRDPCMI